MKSKYSIMCQKKKNTVFSFACSQIQQKSKQSINVLGVFFMEKRTLNTAPELHHTLQRPGSSSKHCLLRPS